MAMGRCLACKKTAELDRAHLKTRAAGAGWEEHEFIRICRACHTAQGQIGWKRFTERYPSLLAELEAKGWVLKQEFSVWKLRRL